MPSRSGTYSTRRSAALLVWRSSMLAGWWRSRQARALARNRDGTRSPAGQPRAGFGASGSRKCASSAAAPAGSRPLVSSTMIRACCQEIVPACRAARVSGSAVVRARDSDRRAPAVAFADGQDTGDLGDQRPSPGRCGPAGTPPAAPGPRLPARSRRPAAPSARRSGPPSGPPRRARPGNRPPAPQRIGVRATGSTTAGLASLSGRAGQGSQRGNGRGDGLHGRPALRTPTLSCSPYPQHLRRHRQFLMKLK